MLLWVARVHEDMKKWWNMREKMSQFSASRLRSFCFLFNYYYFYFNRNYFVASLEYIRSISMDNHHSVFGSWTINLFSYGYSKFVICLVFFLIVNINTKKKIIKMAFKVNTLCFVKIIKKTVISDLKCYVTKVYSKIEL